MIELDRPKTELFSPQERLSIMEVFWDQFADNESAAYAEAPFRQLLLDRQVVDELVQAFHGKCAFCEIRLEEDDDTVGFFDGFDHFRPPNNTINFQGDHFPRHYFWLGLEWTNVHLTCRTCSESKGNRFPIADEAKRAPVPDSPDFDVEILERKLKREQPLLIDPCRDKPDKHLTFDITDGRVSPLTEQGEVTIDLYSLNRPQLIEARLAAARDLQQDLELIQHFTAEDGEKLLGDAVPYAAIRRQVFRSWAPGHTIDPDVKYKTKPDRSTRRPLDVPQQKPDPAGDPEDGGDTSYFRRSRKIEKVVLKNFRSIEELTLDMVPSSAERAGWTVILGENGTGKSTMLHGMALALASDDYRETLRQERGLDGSAFVRRVTEGEQPESGSVEVFLAGASEPIRLEVRRGQPKFFGESGPEILLLGYGSTRLLPRGRGEAAAGTRGARVDNLFDPFVPLGDARRWLLERSEEEFKPLAASFAKLLDLGSDVQLIQNRKKERLDVHIYDTIVPLEQLSDGYQSVVALTADIMSILHSRWGSMAVAEGVVLLDELGAHLHPKWRMGIVKSLRETFPRVQFIVTTHDPLCLRGLKAGEVIVMHRDANRRVMARTDLPSVEALRVDQLLTSEHFGLSSTLDPEVERDFDRYYELLAKDELTDDEKSSLKKLEGRFSSRNLLGETRRERLMLKAIDRHLAREPGFDDKERQQAEADLDTELDGILAALEV